MAEQSNRGLAWLGIALLLLAMLVSLIPGFTSITGRLIFSGGWSLGTGLILAYILLTGQVPLRGGSSWPTFQDRPGQAVFGLLLYLGLFGYMLVLFIRTLTGK